MKADFIIIGGGLSGLLASLTLLKHYPHKTVKLLEKEEEFGGKYNSELGMDLLSAELFDYLDQRLRLGPLNMDIHIYEPKKIEHFALLLGSQIREFRIGKLLSASVVQALGGMSASAAFKKLNWKSLGNEENHNKTFKAWFTEDSKSSLAKVLEQIFRFMGLSDPWKMPCKYISERLAFYKQDMWKLQIKNLLEDSFEQLSKQFSFEALKKTAVFNIKTKNNSQILLNTEHSQIETQKVYLAHSPWDFAAWCPRDMWSKNLTQLVANVRPHSHLSLSYSTNEYMAKEPESYLIPAEDCRVLVYGHNLTFSQAISFEESLNKEVTAKYVKKCRRAARKLFLALGIDSKNLQENFLALTPAAWINPKNRGDEKYFSKSYSSGNLNFLFDSYELIGHSDKAFIGAIHNFEKTVT